MPSGPASARSPVRVLGAAAIAGVFALGLGLPQLGTAGAPNKAQPPSLPALSPVSPLQLAADETPAAVDAILRRSGLPRSAFAIEVRPVDRAETTPLVSLNADRPYLLASTAKLVTTMAALDLLGQDHHWVTIAQTTGPVAGGRLAGDLVLTRRRGVLPPFAGRGQTDGRVALRAQLSGTGCRASLGNQAGGRRRWAPRYLRAVGSRARSAAQQGSCRAERKILSLLSPGGAVRRTRHPSAD